MTGMIFDIKRFAVHDGPGIRTTVFLKGCPLNCAWCQNPEGIRHTKTLWYFQNKCIQCNQCISACQAKALSLGEGTRHIVIDRKKCVHLGGCIEICPTNALSFDGRSVTVDAVIDEINKDAFFYKQSGGGVTLSGGDPLFQPAFSHGILKEAKVIGLHTAVETSLYGDWTAVEKLAEYTDLFFIDIKLFDAAAHKKYTGVENHLIKQNFERLAKRKAEIVVRIPLIPGITTTEENIDQTAHYIKAIRGDIGIELINFNPLAENKFRIMEKNFDVIKGMEPLSEPAVNQLYQRIADIGCKTIG